MELFEEADDSTIHVNRKTLKLKDLHLAIRMCGCKTNNLQDFKQSELRAKVCAVLVLC